FVLAVPIGFGVALLVRRSIALNSETTARATADRLLAEARTKQKDIILEAKDEALKVAKSAELENRERRAELQRYETRLDKKDEQLDTQAAELTSKERKIAERESSLESERTKIEQLQEEQRVELARVAGLSQDEARGLLLESVEEEMRDITNRTVREYEIEARERADEKARATITMHLPRYRALPPVSHP